MAWSDTARKLKRPALRNACKPAGTRTAPTACPSRWPGAAPSSPRRPRRGGRPVHPAPPRRNRPGGRRM